MVRLFLSFNSLTVFSMHRKRQHLLVAAFVFLALIAFNSLLTRKEKFSEGTTPRNGRVVFSAPSGRYVTKSLAELGKMDEVNKYFLFFNHVPKSGAEVVLLLLQKLQGANGFKHVRLKGGNKRRLSNMQQEELVYEMYSSMKKAAVPLSFDRNVYFVDFQSYDKQLPTYINFVRDPVDRIIYRRPFKNVSKKYDVYYDCLFNKTNNCNYKTGHSYDLSIPYFCGHDTRCTLLNNEWAFQKAKENVEKYYPVVGILEELNATLEVLEEKVPFFFKGIQHTYQNKLMSIHQMSKRPKVPPKVIKKLKDTLRMENEFYDWLRGRLFEQLRIFHGH